MEYLSRLASMALKSKGSKIFTIQDGHEMTITPAGDGKTMTVRHTKQKELAILSKKLNVF